MVGNLVSCMPILLWACLSCFGHAYLVLGMPILFWACLSFFGHAYLVLGMPILFCACLSSFGHVYLVFGMTIGFWAEPTGLGTIHLVWGIAIYLCNRLYPDFMIGNMSSGLVFRHCLHIDNLDLFLGLTTWICSQTQQQLTKSQNKCFISFLVNIYITLYEFLISLLFL